MGAIFEGPTLRSTKTVAMPTCTLHHDAGAPPCPSCETPHARTCAPWEGVETHEFDCVCPRCREAWLLSDTDSEELFGVAMRSRSEEWEPNWSEEVLTRGATSQEILDEWRPECWFREDQQERARSPAHTQFHPHPSPLAPTLHARSDPAAPHRRPPSRRRRRTTRSTRRLASRHASTAPAPLVGCFHVHRMPTARTLHAHCTLTLRTHCVRLRTLPTCTPACTPANRKPPTANPLCTRPHCTHLARTGTAHTTSPTRRGDSRRSARGDGTGDTGQEEGWTARATSLLKAAPV